MLLDDVVLDAIILENSTSYFTSISAFVIYNFLGNFSEDSFSYQVTNLVTNSTGNASLILQKNLVQNPLSRNITQNEDTVFWITLGTEKRKHNSAKNRKIICM